jgi:hypothetical protein
MCTSDRRLTSSPVGQVRDTALHWLSAALLFTGCSKSVQELADALTALTDKHESLYNQMIDCQQRYADLLAKATDLQSVKQVKPQTSAEVQKYRGLGDQFLKVEGLTIDKLKGILERTSDRRKTINAQIKEQMERLTANGTDSEMRLAIPTLEWSSATLDFAFDADAVANGKKRHKDQLKDQMEAAKERMKESQEAMKARMEESRSQMKSRMEEMRPKMRGPGFNPAPTGPR